MLEKKCIKCNEIKKIELFGKQLSNKDGYKNTCKLCMCEYSKQHREKNREKELERSKKYYENNKENKKTYYENNKEKIKKQKADYWKNNKTALLKYHETYRNDNRELINKKSCEYYKNKINNDSIFKLKKQFKCLVRDSLKRKNYTKQSRSYNVLGCSYEEFKQYLESKFEPWMNWDNKGLYNGELNHGWDIDHIIPISTANSYDEILKLNHYTNLQPLCSYTNRIIKRDKL